MKKTIALVAALCLVTILFSYFFLSGAADDLATVYFEQGVAERMGSDIVVKGLGLEQANGTLLAMDPSLTSVIPYYLFTCDVKIAASQGSERIVLLDDLANVASTPYNRNRLIEGELQTGDAVAIVDYALAQKRGISVGDSMDILFADEFVTFTVCAITETDPMGDDKGSMLIAYAGEQKEIVTAARKTPLQYSGAFLQSSDVTSTLENLKQNYKPEATKPTPENFINYIVYESYLEQWETQDHSSMVKNVTDYADMQVLESGKQAANIARIIICAILVVAAVLAELLYFVIFRTKIRREVNTYLSVEKEQAKKKFSFKAMMPVLLRHAHPLQYALTAFLNVVAVLAVTFVVVERLNAFYPLIQAFFFVLPCVVVGVVAAAVAYGVAMIMLWSYKAK